MKSSQVFTKYLIFIESCVFWSSSSGVIYGYRLTVLDYINCYTVLPVRDIF